MFSIAAPSTAGIGHCGDGQVGLALEHRGDHRGQAARPGRADLDLVRVFLCVRDKLLDGVIGGIGPRDQDRHATGEDVDRRELGVVDVAEAHDLVQLRVLGAHQQGVAVGRLRIDELRRDGPDAAGAVRHDDVLAQYLLGMRRHGAHHGVGRAAGPPLDDPLDVLRGIVLRKRRHRQRECRNSTHEQSGHLSSLSLPVAGAALPATP
jgi:hypothetical protein